MKNSILLSKLKESFLVSAITLFLISLSAGPLNAKLKSDLKYAIPLFFQDGLFAPDDYKVMNQFIKDEDSVFLKDYPTITMFYKKVNRGKAVIISNSMEGLRRFSHFLKMKKINLEYICYSLELSEKGATPKKEKEDIISAIQDAKMLARDKEVELILAPESIETFNMYLIDISKYADIIILPLQEIQGLALEDFLKEAILLIDASKKENKKVKVMIKLTTESLSTGGENVIKSFSVEDMISKLSSIEDKIDGVYFVMSKEENGLGLINELLLNAR